MLKCSSTGEIDKTIESGKSWQSIREAFCAAHVSTGVATSPEAEPDCSMPGQSSHEDHLGSPGETCLALLHLVRKGGSPNSVSAGLSMKKRSLSEDLLSQMMKTNMETKISKAL